MLKPPEPCQVSMPSASTSSSKPRRREVAEDATLDGGLELEPVVGGELGLPLEVGPPPLPSAQVGWSILRWPESAETQPWRKEGPKMA